MNGFKFKRGTTPRLTVKGNFEGLNKIVFQFNDIQKVYKSDGTGDLQLNGDTIIIPFTQEETLSLAKTVEMEVKIKDDEDLVDASDIYTTNNLRTIIDEVI